jgi:putative flippase GtrA
MKLACFYGLFALIATLLNIGTQELSLLTYGGPYALYVAIGMGTLAGLVCKYLLDKNYIFHYSAPSPRPRSTFMLYALTGVATTCIFWGMELMFEMIWRSKDMRYLGGMIGLAIGYYTKYQLDKRFVFQEQRDEHL